MKSTFKRRFAIAGLLFLGALHPAAMAAQEALATQPESQEPALVQTNPQPTQGRTPWELQLRMEPRMGLFWNQEWDPAWSGLALGLALRGPLELTAGNPESWWLPNQWQTGLDYSLSGLGSQVDLLLGLGWSQNLDSRGQWQQGPLLILNPGLALFRPAPVLVLGFQALWRLQWRPLPWLGLEASTGLRWSTSPEYSQRISPYAVWDWPLGLGISWIWN